MTGPAKHRNLPRAFVAIFAAILAALVVAHPASSAVVDGNSPVTFTLTASSQRSPIININGASTCSVVITSAGTGFTLTPQATSDTQANVAANTASWNTATGISSGSITSTGTYTGSIAASGLTAFSVYSTTIGSANIVGSIYCSSAEIPGSGGGGSYPTPIPTLSPNADGGAPVHVQNASSFPTPIARATDSSGNLLTSTTYQSNDVTGTLGALNATVSITLSKETGVMAYIAGTWVGTIQYQASVDCTHFVPIVLSSVAGGNGNSSSTSANPTSNVAAFDVSGYKCFQLLMSSYTSGSATVALHASNSAPHGTSSNYYGGMPQVIISGSNGSAVTTGSATDAESIGSYLAVISGNQLFNGTTWDRTRKDTYAAGPQWMTTGGSATAAIAAATSGPTVIKATAGRLARLLITTAGTSGTETFYDNASACSGTVIGVVQGSTGDTTAVAGRVTSVDLVAVNGITACGGTGSPAVTVGYF